MIQFVDPYFLGDASEFKHKFDLPIRDGHYVDSTEDDVEKMKRKSYVLCNQLETSGIVHRQSQEILRKELPLLHEYVLSVRLTSLQMELYKLYLAGHSNIDENGEFCGKLANCQLFKDYHTLNRYLC